MATVPHPLTYHFVEKKRLPTSKRNGRIDSLCRQSDGRAHGANSQPLDQKKTRKRQTEKQISGLLPIKIPGGLRLLAWILQDNFATYSTYVLYMIRYLASSPLLQWPRSKDRALAWNKKKATGTGRAKRPVWGFSGVTLPVAVPLPLCCEMPHPPPDARSWLPPLHKKLGSGRSSHTVSDSMCALLSASPQNKFPT